jgi:hypothetical protein
MTTNKGAYFMNSKILLGIILVSIALVSVLTPPSSAETLVKEDFEKERVTGMNPCLLIT